MVLYATLGACALGASLLVYRYDMYDREPAWALLLSFASGALAMAALGPIEAATHDAWREPASAARLAAVAALEEELAKLLVVVAIAVLAPRRFNDPMDGIVYGSVAGLGTAFEESVASLRDYPSGLTLLPGAEVVRLCGHLVMGGIGGFGVGLARAGTRLWKLVLPLSWCAALALHFLWDWIALWQPPPDLRPWQATGAAALMLAGLGLYGYLVHEGSARSRRVFARDSRATLWGWPFRR
ncbi:MAG TPA: PrsW family glutamic-type intramembrane protease [Vicinamibacteria bacterium]|nr:PrsW family glutamic-type intramembrane protease [Vicinamibacteria bacterium]